MQVNKGSGKVILVGAGPGDPGLITVRGLEALRRAEVVVYDRLVPGALLEEAPASAERIYVGKAPGRHPLDQATINGILIEGARAGRLVVRLKGGDPFLFGRGGEEVLALRQAGVPVEVVPGVSSALAVPAVAGIPLTHRGVSSSVALLTGHGAAGPGAPVRWAAVARAVDTLVVLMGMQTLPAIVEQLLAAGLPPDTPGCVIERGTLAGQRSVTAPLSQLPGQVSRAGLGPPAIIVIGRVVHLQGAAGLEGEPPPSC